jgi:hypothetical protein
VFDRTLFRVGDTVHMKHVLRRPTQAGFGAVPADLAPLEGVIQHVGSDDSWDLPLSWDAQGSALSEWKVPAYAKLGSYRVELRDARNRRGGRRGIGHVSASRHSACRS